MKNLVIYFCFIALAVTTSEAQRTSRIQKPCPGTTVNARVEAEADGDVIIRPCDDANVRIGDYEGVYGDPYIVLDSANYQVNVNGLLNAALGTSGAYLSLGALPSLKKFDFQVGTLDGQVRFLGINRFIFLRTVTAAGTTGNQTINEPVGSVNFAAGASSITVSNSTVFADSLIFCTVQSNDATATACRVTDKGTGSFNIRLNANATAETAVAFWVTN